jgi:hypothetical protein
LCINTGNPARQRVFDVVFLKSIHPQAKTVLVPPADLDLVCVFVGKDKQGWLNGIK